MKLKESWESNPSNTLQSFATRLEMIIDFPCCSNNKDSGLYSNKRHFFMKLSTGFSIRLCTSIVCSRDSLLSLPSLRFPYKVTVSIKTNWDVKKSSYTVLHLSITHKNCTLQKPAITKPSIRALVFSLWKTVLSQLFDGKKTLNVNSSTSKAPLNCSFKWQLMLWKKSSDRMKKGFVTNH